MDGPRRRPRDTAQTVGLPADRRLRPIRRVRLRPAPTQGGGDPRVRRTGVVAARVKDGYAETDTNPAHTVLLVAFLCAGELGRRGWGSASGAPSTKETT